MSIQTTPPVAQTPAMGFGGPQRGFGGPPQAAMAGPPTMPGMSPSSKVPQGELWIETKTSEGKSYFYHAVTRQTTWNRPTGPGIQVMTQQEVENMSKAQQMHPKQQGQSPMQQQQP